MLSSNALSPRWEERAPTLPGESGIVLGAGQAPAFSEEGGGAALRKNGRLFLSVLGADATAAPARPLLFPEPNKYQAFDQRHLDAIPQLAALPDHERAALRVVSKVLPFRVSNYVLDELIRWDDVPNDPIFQLTFPHRGMLAPADFERIEALMAKGVRKAELDAVVRDIQRGMNPHPSKQKELNVPIWQGRPLRGVQHKYRDTVLFFPSQGQTCHSYCAYCFRWAQFVGLDDMTFADREVTSLVDYIQAKRSVTDVLFTGGDPLVMRTKVLRRYVEPLLEDRLDNLRTIRIGSKALSFWPHRFVTDEDADDLLRLFEEVVKSGRQLAFMAHFSHPRELETPGVQKAIRRIIDTGAIIRSQAPLIRHINDDASAWAGMWTRQLSARVVPYYMFVERDTGAKHHFDVPLARAYEIYRDAVKSVSGLARTARGPVMSATPGKVAIDGITEINGEKVFVLRFLQARNPDWILRPFFAKFDEKATWLDQLKPAFGEREHFYEAEMREIEKAALSMHQEASNG